MKSSLLILFTAALFTLTACKGGDTLPDATAGNTAGGGFGDGGASTAGNGDGSGITTSPLEEEQRRLMEQLVVYFDYDQAEIKPEYTALLAAHGQFLAQNASSQLRLEGHTDERGSREYNIGLGERRAQAVRRILMLQGATANQLSTVSYGEERPAATGSDEEAWRLNRRVELVYR